MVQHGPYQLTDDTNEEDPGDDPDVEHGDRSVLVRVSRSSEVLCLRRCLFIPSQLSHHTFPLGPSQQS